MQEGGGKRRASHLKLERTVHNLYINSCVQNGQFNVFIYINISIIDKLRKTQLKQTSDHNL